MTAIFLWILACAVLVAIAGLAYQTLGTRRDARLHPPPGRLVDIGGHRLHVVESGIASGPTILLEAGLMSTLLSWSSLQRELARSFRVVSYDRAGLGWSELGPMPRTAGRLVDELHTLLERSSIPPPYVLVGHSFGGLTMPLFAARFPNEVAGMVLLDPVVPAEWDPPSQHDVKLTRIGAKVCRRASFLARVGVLRLVCSLLTGRTKRLASHLVRLISRGSPADSGTVSSPWFTALPENERTMAAIFWVQQKFALTIASQLENLPASAAQVRQAPGALDKPVIVLSASTASEKRRKGHQDIAARLPQGEYKLAEKSNHWIMQQQPDLVIAAIERVVERSQEVADRATATASGKG